MHFCFILAVWKINSPLLDYYASEMIYVNFNFLGGEIASTFDHPELVKLGSCKLIEEVMIGEDKLIHFSGVAMGKIYLFYLF